MLERSRIGFKTGAERYRLNDTRRYRTGLKTDCRALQSRFRVKAYTLDGTKIAGIS